MSRHWRPGAPPAPFDISKELGSIRPGLFDRLHQRYRLAYVLGYSAGRGGGSESKKTGHSDPTGDVTADKEWFRTQVELAGRKIMEACSALDRADAALAEVTEKAGEYERIKHKAGEIPLNPQEVQAAKKEQRRLVHSHKKSRGNP